jgi:hypothetical protein
METRVSAKIAAIGTAIGIHSCAVSGVPVSALNDVDDFSINAAKNSIVASLSASRVVFDDVAAAACILTKTLSRNTVLPPSWENLIAGRVEAAMKNEDSVVNLMHKRVESFFSANATKSWNTENSLPSSMSSGKLSSDEQHRLPNGDSSEHEGLRMQTWSEQEAKRVGLGFFSPELSKLGARVHFIVSHAVDVFSEQLLEPLLTRELSERSERSVVR